MKTSNIFPSSTSQNPEDKFEAKWELFEEEHLKYPSMPPLYYVQGTIISSNSAGTKFEVEFPVLGIKRDMDESHRYTNNGERKLLSSDCLQRWSSLEHLPLVAKTPDRPPSNTVEPSVHQPDADVEEIRKEIASYRAEFIKQSNTDERRDIYAKVIASRTEYLNKLLDQRSANIARASGFREVMAQESALMPVTLTLKTAGYDEAHDRLIKQWRAIVDGSITYENDCWVINDGTLWDRRVPKLLSRGCYNAMVDFMGLESGKMEAVLLTGTPGTGKTLFLSRLLIEIHRVNPTKNILYMLRGGAVLLLLSNGVVRDRIDQPFHIVLSDSWDIPEFRCEGLHLVVASHKSKQNLKGIQRLVKKSGTKGATIWMDPFSFEELMSIKPDDMTPEEAAFRHSVFGGSARNFFWFANHAGYKEEGGIVREILDQVFPSVEDRFKFRVDHVLTPYLQTVNPSQISTLATNMFYHMSSKGEGFWATTFMGILVCELLERAETTVVQFLTQAIQRSGLGYLHESLGHLRLMRAKTIHIFNLKTNATEEINIPRDIMVFKGEDDIANLKPNFYCLPDIFNFALVDAIVPPEWYFQYTVSPTHGGALSKLPLIRQKLCDAVIDYTEGVKPKRSDLMARHKLIYVVPRGNTIQPNSKIKMPQYVTYSHATTAMALMKNVCKDAEKGTEETLEEEDDADVGKGTRKRKREANQAGRTPTKVSTKPGRRHA